MNAKAQTRYLRDVPKGEVVFNQGDPGDVLYVVRSGRIELRERLRPDTSEEIELVEAGDLFGEISVLTGRQRDATAIVVEDAQLLEVDRSTLETMLRRDIEVAVRLIQKLSTQVDQALELLHQHQPALTGVSDKAGDSDARPERQESAAKPADVIPMASRQVGHSHEPRRATRHNDAQTMSSPAPEVRPKKRSRVQALWCHVQRMSTAQVLATSFLLALTIGALAGYLLAWGYHKSIGQSEDISRTSSEQKASAVLASRSVLSEQSRPISPNKQSKASRVGSDPAARNSQTALAKNALTKERAENEPKSRRRQRLPVKKSKTKTKALSRTSKKRREIGKRRAARLRAARLKKAKAKRTTPKKVPAKQVKDDRQAKAGPAKDAKKLKQMPVDAKAKDSSKSEPKEATEKKQPASHQSGQQAVNDKTATAKKKPPHEFRLPKWTATAER